MDAILRLPMLTVTNPVLLWLFKHGWEDPEWGRMPVNQVALGLVIQEIGTRLADPGAREQVLAIGARVIAENAKEIMQGKSVGQGAA